jgi:hypothetical protein
MLRRSSSEGHLVMGTLSRRTLVLGVAGIAICAAGIGAAFAAWSSSGSGTAAVRAGTTTEFIVSVGSVTGLYPTGSAAVDFTVENTNPYAVTLSRASARKITVDAKHADCDPSTVQIKDVALKDVIAPGKTSSKQSVTVTMSNEATDACQGASFTFSLLVGGASS